ncbi:MAG: 1-acyl-sn-glycerol-3-phosphate acyltransferase [Acidobacteriales bacterium]|nr:1-acyl-sn-glycerol-3-phosphate acyltransferase [Terriglobales bacterium]
MNSPNTLRHWLSRLRSYFVLNPLIFFYTGILGALSLISSFFDHEGRTQHNFARFWSHLILRTSMSPVEVIGLDKLDLSRPYVYAANHISAMDIPVLYDNLPIQFRIVANKYLFRYPFLGWHLKRSGQIPIDRSSPRATFKSLNSAVHDLRDGLSVMIFPEGGRSHDGHIMPFMNGAFYLAIKAQVPIVPLAIIGTFEMLPMNTFHIMPHNLRLIIGDPIPTTGLTTHDLESVAAQTQKSIEDMYYTHSNIPDPRLAEHSV